MVLMGYCVSGAVTGDGDRVKGKTVNSVLLCC